MANYNSIGAYEAQTLIPEFLGLMQHGDGINADPRYAVDVLNMDTPGGVLQPMAACSLLTPSLPQPIETLATLHRRWYTGQDDKNIFIAASDGKLYAALPTASAWTELAFPLGIMAYDSNEWSWAAYEINPPGSSAPVDVLLLSNAEDGMIMVRGDDLSVEIVETPKKFGVIARYAERIWGGAIMDDPDMLVYSAPFDPTNWDEDVDFPEDGAGDIMQPSWDGDSFTALHAFGSQLIAFKRTRVWRILGTDPGEYAFKEQYGGGAPYHATIAVDAERIFMLTQQGLAVYDGLSVNPFRQEFAEGVFRRMNKAKLDQACGCIWQDRYYLALPMETSIINNAVLIFNLKNNTWLLREDVSVEAFQPTEDALYFTSSTTPGKIWAWKEDSWLNGATTAACKWVSPWNDLGHQEIKKGGFDVYLLCEVKSSAATISLSIQTEKKTKTKSYTVQPLGEGQTEFRQKRLHFGGSGRRFRIIIESAASMPVWRLIGGIRIISETDPD
jgi:hypothetical protein